MSATLRSVALVLMLSAASFLAGCAKDQGQIDTSGVTGRGGPLPGSARIYGEGEGHLSFRAPAPGVMYLYDIDSQRVVLSQQMEQGQRIDIDTTRNQVTLSGYPPQTRSLSKEHSYRIYFDRVPGAK